jgi:hypothetical protein
MTTEAPCTASADGGVANETVAAVTPLAPTGTVAAVEESRLTPLAPVRVTEMFLLSHAGEAIEFTVAADTS